MKLTTGVVVIRELTTREWATRELAVNSDVFSETRSCSAQPGLDEIGRYGSVESAVARECTNPDEVAGV